MAGHGHPLEETLLNGEKSKREVLMSSVCVIAVDDVCQKGTEWERERETERETERQRERERETERQREIQSKEKIVKE